MAGNTTKGFRISDEVREILRKQAKAASRGIAGQIEYLILQEEKRIKGE